ncbi:hypothetical protein EDB92DRAFT_840120 [Lactarius akahatsu]|uniref:Uncharacterized protein n=1 Tax=Lactarius akahatsu TaxID=416441 RepID=A0AAD4LEU3_9AGAM|nr:hypothetical protein EDB92DRAFT_840120 [Lactarius akahatsu]
MPWPIIRKILSYFSQISRASAPSALQELTVPSAPSLIRSVALNPYAHSLCLEDNHERNRFILPDDLFGGKAPIRYLQFTAGCQIVAPHWLLHSVTHFTSAEAISHSELLDALRQMPALTYLEFHPLAFLWSNLDLDKLRASQIYMPHLMNLIAHTSYFPGSVIFLNQLLSLRAGTKRRLELHPPEFCGWAGRKDWIEGLSPILKAADGFRHIYFPGEQKEGWFCLWTGSAATAWEDAEFCIFSEWRQLRGPNASRSDSSRFVALGVALVRKLVINLPSPHPEKFWYRKNDLSESYWWDLLEELPGIDELELRSAVEREIAAAWEVSVAPAVLPALRRVRIVAPKLDLLSPQYAIIGDFPARRTMRLLNSTEGDDAYNCLLWYRPVPVLLCT